METNKSSNTAKTNIIDMWKTDKQKVIKLIHEAIGTPATYIEFKTINKEADIKKIIYDICDNLKKDKTPKEWTSETISQAAKITRFYADIIQQRKKEKERQSLLSKNKETETDKNNQNGQAANNEINNATNNDQPNTSKENKRKQKDTEDDNDIIIDADKLNKIVDQDNIPPTKRQRAISKSYLKDENELPNGWHKIQSIETKPVVIVKPKDPNQDVSDFKTHVSNTLEDDTRDYGEVEQITKSQKVVIVHFDDIVNRDKFMKYAKNYQPNWISEIPTLKNPCIRIGGVSIRKEPNIEIDWDKWLEKLISKNKWIPKTQDSVFKINFKIEKRGKWNIVFEVSPNIRQAIIQKKGKIYSGTQKYDVYDTFNIHTCYNCSSYGHTTNQCGQQPVCRYCAKQHFNKCPVKDNTTKYKCHACKNNGHAFNHPQCPQYLWRLKHELQFINMNYEIIMTPPTQ